uniref:Uncharacterized protein n=1 Tax=viral metagenome TaxID=1070528 RepID=A0A6C0D164_9ZZZZ
MDTKEPKTRQEIKGKDEKKHKHHHSLYNQKSIRLSLALLEKKNKIEKDSKNS